MAIQELDPSNFDEVINSATKPVLVDFWASWCGPCRILAPIVKEISEDFADTLQVCKVDVETYQELAVRFGVMSIPTLMFFKDGAQVHTLVGAAPKAKIEQDIRQVFGL